ncbi:MAG: Serine acetyltransferase, partial [Cypionkella sp.]|nr:Serine acetyltransferase [Cypionkella sp.]
MNRNVVVSEAQDAVLFDLGQIVEDLAEVRRDWRRSQGVTAEAGGANCPRVSRLRASWKA